ncbi:xanthine dehydrogenase family protein molybdopterin-binding subunit [Halanaerobium sp. Z-7514]|uniref:Xanthine dehydrogenase family protein molybdopterin-binding subunit n=1 Tax=Halanaerobium polyolivorans TaxID=2886943 RepID=A0AAW4WT78_9FIRM|nr:xanthine dehydrogenase family protein molybdopterin-binding subunit [Halanaerobium polyolivorans]MCC3144297.1 xanthine dehydrogenase family protein molybdopterin-binding subunit [Halanaerobium polyolivorans]
MAFKHVNKGVKRVDAYEKVTGKAKFGADLEFADQLYAKVLRTEYPHARIINIETAEAEKMPGVRGVFTAADIKNNLFGVIVEDQQVLAADRVVLAGDGVAMVAAESEAEAAAALEKIKVEYEELEGIYELDEARKKDSLKIHPEKDDNQVIHHPLRKGDVEKGFAQADIILEREYSTQLIEHSYLEPEAVVVVPEDENHLVSIYGSIQNPYATRAAVATVLRAELAEVRVIQNHIGGSFGGKDEVVSAMAARAAVMALATKRPVKMVNSREESFTESYKRHPYQLKYKVGATKEGKLTAMEIEAAADSGAYACQTPFVTWRSVVQATGPYELDHVKTDTYGYYTNNPYTGAMRGYGSPQIIFAQESLMDELAEELGMSPVELRKKNIYRQDSITASGQKLSGHTVSLEEVMDKAMQAIDYQAKREKYSLAQPDDKKRGIGLSISFRGCSLGAEAVDAAASLIQINKDGSVAVYSGLAENGQGLKTIFSQIAAEVLGITLNEIDYMEVDTTFTPDSGSTVASRATLIGGNSIKNAAEKLRDRILDFAAQKFELAKDKLKLEAGFLYDQASNRLALFSDLTAEMINNGILLSAYGWYKGPPISWDEEKGCGNPYFTYVYGCQIAEVEVDTGTGELTVLNMAAAHDVGRAINPKNVKGQIYGGVMMGLGYSIMEEVEVEAGQIKGKNFHDYMIPTIKDMPDIEAVIVENPDPDGPFGAKSIGEPTLELASAAIANAVAHASGKRIRSLPLNLERVLIGRALSKGGCK